jgi:hypothetical protein
MNYEETIAQLRAVRETTERTIHVINAAIERLEGFQSVADAFTRWQRAQQAQWQAMMEAGGPFDVDIEEQSRHAAELRRAEAMLTRALQQHFAASEQEQMPADTPSGQEYAYQGDA